MSAERRLMSELQQLRKEKWVHLDFDDANMRKWNLGLMVVNPDSVFRGAYFKVRPLNPSLERSNFLTAMQAEMTFPKNYPIDPPSFRFVDNKYLFHPNIYSDGRLCISILHAPGEDEMSGEMASERWSPLQGVESVLRSVLLLLDNPEIGSPANVDAGVVYRDNREEYDKKAKMAVEKSQKDIPAGVKVPTPEDLMNKPAKSSYDDDDFWNETDEDDFDASDSDVDMEEEEDDDDDDDDDD